MQNHFTTEIEKYCKITEGPWEINIKTAHYEVVLPQSATLEDRVRLERLQAYGLHRMECLSVGTANGQVAIIPLDESNHANAKLIAAAPKLLSALQGILNNSMLDETEYGQEFLAAKAAIDSVL